MSTLLLILLLAPFVLAVFLPALGARLGAKVGWVALLAPLTSLAAAVGLWRLPAAERSAPLSFAWAPEFGVNLSFLPDGLGLLYALIVSGVGVLVVFYAACYLDDDHYRDHGKFYCYLLLFMGAMFATVLSSNLLVLFVAWEMTGLTSFLLIGFLHEKQESQRGARMALLTTGGTGLALLVGVLLLGVVFGSYELTEILAADGPRPGTEGLLAAAFLCCFLGIAGKSAQFPFHYWLPNAMAAPTPVSAYLHSATMVKLGVFLTARLLPVFDDLEAWMPLLTGIGFGTMLLGAVYALLSQDLKSVLAYTTVSQLGLLIGYYGLHVSGAGVPWDALHILNHVFYKACLFMVVGIIDHCTGTRDLRELGGLGRKMPVVAVAALCALAAFAGLPPTTGFLSKEMLLVDLYALFHGAGGLQGLWPLGCVVLASTCNVAVALRIGRVFFGSESEAVKHHFHAPSAGLQLPPALLGAATLALGLAAPFFGRLCASFADSAGRVAAEKELHLWHGVNAELITSALVVAAGLTLFALVGARRWARAALPRPLRFDLGFDVVAEGTPYFGKYLNRRLGFENPYVAVFVVVGTGLVLMTGLLLPHWGELSLLASEWAPWPAEASGWWRWAVVLVTGGAALAAAAWKQPIRQVCALSVVGLGITLYYVMYRAPDLALTQMLVETATLLLILLVVLRLKREGADREAMPPHHPLTKPLRVALSIFFGLVVGGGVLVFQNPPSAERAGEFYLAQSVPLAKGANAVNTVLVDFRGFDTLMEIAVLLIAALGCLGLLHRARAGAPRAAAAEGNPELHPVPRDLILRQVGLWAFVPLNLFAAYLFLRGHQAPGGGFIAGLVSSLSLLLLVFVLGVHGVRRLIRFNPVLLAVGGVGLSLATALLPTLLGLPVFHHFHGYLAGFYIGTPFWFDLGVYLTVVGVLLKLILPLMKSIHGLPAFVVEEEDRFAELLSEPIDLTPRERTEKGGGA
jgi:NADH:ubiquinone oxidoreductase subunit 5 (subunit L)/multisubunit Na+/H+ antiporter MnhA subunit/uncharacterized MnhB-related membrane protein